MRCMDDLEAALCEAQVAAKVETFWDDLPLPNIDEKRRDWLLRRMPDPAPDPPPGTLRVPSRCGPPLRFCWPAWGRLPGGAEAGGLEGRWTWWR